jgi:O-antigen ligase
MTSTEFIFGTGYSIFALISALGLVLFFAVLLHGEQRYGHWARPAMVPIIALGIRASSLLSGRNLQYAATDLSLGMDGTAGDSSLLLRVFTLAILGISLARVTGQWLRRREVPAFGGTDLFVAFFAFFVAHTVLNSIFGTQPVFIHNIFYGIAAFAAIFAARREPLSITISFAKLALFSLMFLSLIAALVVPSLAVEPGYKGWIPGLSIRLWGVGSNANSIGPLALVAMLIEYMQPYQRRWLHWPLLLLSFIVFVVAQSKTVWVVFVILIPILFWYRMAKPKRGLDVRLVLFLIGVASFTLLSLLFFDPISLWEQVMNTREGSQLGTLTGRSQIWAIAINEWLNNVVFGFGPDIWGPAYRARIGLQFATSAHNQFLQSLSAAGALGLTALLIYLVLLGRYALRSAAATKGVSVALFLLVLLRCMTETPLTLGTFFNGDFLTHILLFTICITYGGRALTAGETVSRQRAELHHKAA